MPNDFNKMDYKQIFPDLYELLKIPFITTSPPVKGMVLFEMGENFEQKTKMMSNKIMKWNTDKIAEQITNIMSKWRTKQ